VCHKDISDTRVDLANLERLERETSGDYTKFLLDETARLEKEFKRLCDIESCKDYKPCSRWNMNHKLILYFLYLWFPIIC
jgi:hypothetical protein